MALYDHRVFQVNSEWWAAQIHSASGAGWGDAPVAISRERVYFSSLTDRERHTVAAAIPPGWLNRLSYGALVRLLRAGKDLGTHFKMSPYNVPSAAELGPPIFTDTEGLRWVVRPTKIIQADLPSAAVLQAAEFVCLDDSALRKDVALSGETFDEFRSQAQPARLAAIVESIKSTFQEYSPRARD
jgi:hypothetical protein